MPSEVITEKKIRDKIEKSLKEGFTIKQIKESLISQDWPEQEISKFIFDIKEEKLKDDLLIKPENGPSTKIEQDINKIEQEIKEKYPKIKDEEKIILKPLESPKPEIKKPVQEFKIEKPIIPEFIGKARPKIKLKELEKPRIYGKEPLVIPPSLREAEAKLSNELADIKKEKEQVESSLSREIATLRSNESRLNKELADLKSFRGGTEIKLKEEMDFLGKTNRDRESKLKNELVSLEKELVSLFKKLRDEKREKEQLERNLSREIVFLKEAKKSPKIQSGKQISALEGENNYPTEKESYLEGIKKEVEDLEKKIEVPPVQISAGNQKEIKSCAADIQRIKKEIERIIVGQEKVINSLLKALLSNGHVLVEGVPGIAKTLIIRALAQTSGCKFKRIQFTVDLLPTDIVGFISYNKQKGFYTVKGPIFTNFIIADEINRATPKSQSALLEAMQERQVTIGKNTFPLPNPFFVMANKNPIESSGVYPLPEAQRDRFLFKTIVGYPTIEEEKIILKQNVSLKTFEDFEIKSVINPSRLLKMQEITQKIYLDPEIEKYIVDITHATRKPSKYKLELGKYIEYGASPRASIGMFIASKADALLNGKSFVSPQNVKNVAHEVLRHRIILNYEALAEKIKEEQIIDEILSKVPVP